MSTSSGRTLKPRLTKAMHTSHGAAGIGAPLTWTLIEKILAVRLINPHPECEVASLTLEEAANEPWSPPSFLAITAEPLDL